MVAIYCLRLEENKYYVGKTNHIEFRLENHTDSVENIWPNCDDFDEDKYTKIMMYKHGADNVRGGSYSQIRLPAAR